MTPERSVHTFVRVMKESQRQYIEEVLGVSYFSGIAEEAADTAHHEILVLTAPLNDEQRTLLGKILASIKIAGFLHLEVPSVNVGQFPETISATHVLAFTEGVSGRQSIGESVWWMLPSVESMTGANADVVLQKKEAWNWLQQFSKEIQQ